MFYKWFITVCYKGKPVTGPVIVDKAKSLYDEIKIIDMCTFPDSWLESNKKKMPVIRSV